MATSNAITFNPKHDDGFETPRLKAAPSKAKKSMLAQSGGTMASRATAQTGVGAIMDELDKLQGQQITFQRKTDKEKSRKEVLEAKIQEVTNALNYYRSATKSGSVVKDDEVVKKKMIGKLEHQMSEARNKLSSFRKQNQALKTEIIEGRQDKLMHLTIHKELSHELKESTSNLELYKEEVNVVSNRKQRKEVEISNMRQGIFDEMDKFSAELQRAQRDVSKTQKNILHGIREKLELSFTPLIDTSPKKVHVEPEAQVDESAVARARKVQDMLTEVGAESLEDVIINLQKSEEEMYTKYHEIQETTGEMEKLDVSNKHLEHDLGIETNKLKELEAKSERQTQELEENINDMQSQIQKMVNNYDKSMLVLQGVQKELMGILAHIAVEGDSADKAMQATGVTDRNIPQFLGRVEERIDTLIQMNKAAHHIGIQKEDFRSGQVKASKAASKDFQPYLPSMMDEFEVSKEKASLNVEAEKVTVLKVSELKEFMRRRVSQAEIQKREAESPTTPQTSRKTTMMSSQRTGTPQRMSMSARTTPALTREAPSADGNNPALSGFGEEKDASHPNSSDAVAGAGAVKIEGGTRQTSPIAKSVAGATVKESTRSPERGGGTPDNEASERISTASSQGSGKRSSVVDTRSKSEKFEHMMSVRKQGDGAEGKAIDLNHVAKSTAIPTSAIQPTAPLELRPANSSGRPTSRASATKPSSVKAPTSSRAPPGSAK